MKSGNIVSFMQLTHIESSKHTGLELADPVDGNLIEETVHTGVDERNLLIDTHGLVLLLPVTIVRPDTRHACVCHHSETYLRSSVRRSPRAKVDLVDASRSEPN